MSNITGKKILLEEVIKFLNEAYLMKNDSFNFRQKITNSTFFNYSSFSNDFDVDIGESDIVVNWHIAFWLNHFGVENFVVEVDGVEGIYKIDYYNKQTDQLEQQVDKNIAETPWKFVVDVATLNKGSTLYVETLDFDFKTNICKVTFY